MTDLTLWYDSPTGTEWLRALPIGNGRLGAMVFGNPERETLQLNEDTVWAGGPVDCTNPKGAAALPEVRRLVFEDRWHEAQDLLDQTFLGHPPKQLPYQPVGNLRLWFAAHADVFGVSAGAGPHHRDRVGDLCGR